MKRLEVLVALSICFLSLQAQENWQSRVITDTVYSEVLKAKRAYTVYLPKSFEQNREKKYPVLYLLHGMWEKNDVWANRGHIKDVMDCLTASGEACEMIIVTPDAGGGDPNIFQNGYFDMPGWKYETFFFTEFLPSIEKRYRAIGDKWHRAIAGLSMGGGGAASYGQRHSDMFCAVYAMSALMDIPQEGAARFDDPNGKLAVLTRSVIEKSCMKYITASNEERKTELRSVAWFVDCDDDDFLLDRNIEFYRAMRGANIPCQFRVRDGGHTWEYWHSALYTCLPFVSRQYNSSSFVKSQSEYSMLDEQRQNGYWGDQGDGTYRNPIIAADFSDPDPIRVGNDYYMVTSTFETSPGVTVLHSKDLVNWKIIGGVFEELDRIDPAFSAKYMKRYNGGVYAPAIRYHNGLFYVYVNLYTDGMFYATAKDPAGKWTVHTLKDKYGNPLRMEGWTDPCPFWDKDGKAYLVSSNPGKNWFGYLFEMTPDGSQLLDADVEHMKERGIVYEYPLGGTLYSRNSSTEGNKIYYRNGYYYIIHIEFLDGGNGAGTYVYRSKNLYGIKENGMPGKPGDMGTYEMKRFDLRNTGTYRQEIPGQGGFVDTPDGRWFWIAQFNRYGSDGRTPCLLPVTWIDDWPIVGDSIRGDYGKMSWRRLKPINSKEIVLPHGSDDFSSSDLNERWAWNHQPDDNRWSLKERSGFLRLRATSTVDGTDSFFKAANTIEQRYMSSDSVVITVKLDLSGMSYGQKAGLAHFNGGANYAMCGVQYTESGIQLIHENDGKAITGTILSPGQNLLYIRSVSGFEERDDNKQYTSETQRFLYSVDGKVFVPFGGTYQMRTANFRGDMVGICTYNNQNDKGYVDIDYFEYNVKNRIDAL